MLSNVYADASYWNQSYLRAIYPQPKTLFGRCVRFDAVHGIQGSACEGPPPQGDFAHEAMVGKTYDRARFCGQPAGASSAGPDLASG